MQSEHHGPNQSRTDCFSVVIVLSEGLITTFRSTESGEQRDDPRGGAAQMAASTVPHTAPQYPYLVAVSQNSGYQSVTILPLLL